MAQERFDGRVVAAFYDDLVAEPIDFWSIRESDIPLPTRADGWTRVLLVGTTGAGKTTLVRQILGTDPKTERFPSTSPAKTTIAPMEIISAPGSFGAIITFHPRDYILQLVEECISAAVLIASENRGDSEIMLRLLNHVDQRFRLSYILGNGTAIIADGWDSGDYDDDDDDEEDQEIEEEATSDDIAQMAEQVDVAGTAKHLASILPRLRGLAKKHAEQLRRDLEPTSSADDKVVQELFEEELDSLLREDPDFHEVADELMDEVERRFELLDPETLRRTKQGWPVAWAYSSSDVSASARAEFLRIITRFSSNYARYFGTLLTPLVSGIRVVGPFSPTWSGEDDIPFVLLDGEGLGHAANISPSLSTTVTRRFDDVDAILLVDSAAQPMQAAPLQVLRTVATTGHASKLALCFTHFDEVRGDNLPTLRARRDHVRASLDNALAAIGERVGPSAESALRRQLDARTFFLANIHEPLDDADKAARRSIDEVNRMLEAVGALGQPEPVVAVPVYDSMNLVLAVQQAATSFHELWQALLGQRPKPGVSKEHWTRVKALSRRLGFSWDEEYDTLRPVADLIRELMESVYRFALIQQAGSPGPPQRMRSRSPWTRSHRSLAGKSTHGLESGCTPARHKRGCVRLANVVQGQHSGEQKLSKKTSMIRVRQFRRSARV
jgi:energy-coupling factor transporter ATP-binding protein EcfA2